MVGRVRDWWRKVKTNMWKEKPRQNLSDEGQESEAEEIPRSPPQHWATVLSWSTPTTTTIGQGKGGIVGRGSVSHAVWLPMMMIVVKQNNQYCVFIYLKYKICNCNTCHWILVLHSINNYIINLELLFKEIIIYVHTYKESQMDG